MLTFVLTLLYHEENCNYLLLICSFLGNRGLCGKHINQLCKDDDGVSTGSQPTGFLYNFLISVKLFLVDFI